METSQEFILMLRTRLDIMISSDIEEYLSVLYEECISSKEINPLDYISAAFYDEKIVNMIVNEFNKAKKKANMLAKMNALKKMVSQDVNLKRSFPSISNQEDYEQIKPAKNSKKDQIKVISSKSPKTTEENDQMLQNSPKSQAGDTLNKTTDQLPSESFKKEIEEHQIETPRPQSKKEGIKTSLDASSIKKCRYFPFCANGAKCMYFHPIEKCLYSPRCRYTAEECLYVHEVCKYGSNCCRLNCNYAHEQKGCLNQLMNAMMQVTKRSFSSGGENSQECQDHNQSEIESKQEHEN